MNGPAAPEGLRWANGGGSVIGGANCYHLAPVEVRGTLCGRYGPNTPRVGPGRYAHVCRSCVRIAEARGLPLPGGAPIL